MPRNKVLVLSSCAICGRTARGSFCKKHESFFRIWTRKNAFERKALVNDKHTQIIA